MSQHDYVIDNASGATVRADLNSVLQAIVSKNSGDTAPGTTYAFMWWFETDTDTLWIRNEANTNWVAVASLVGTTWKLYWNGVLLDAAFVANGTGVPSITAGTLAGRPAAGTAGRLYVATDTKQWFRDNGASWDSLFTTDVANAGSTPSVQAGTLAARPAAGTAGRLYVQTDSPYDIFRDNGAAWITLSPGTGGNCNIDWATFTANNINNRQIGVAFTTPYISIARHIASGVVHMSVLFPNGGAGIGVYWTNATPPVPTLFTGSVNSHGFSGGTVRVGQGAAPALNSGTVQQWTMVNIGV